MAKLLVSKRGEVYQYRFEIASVNGKRKQISKSGFKTKKECQKAGTQAMNEYNNSGQHHEPSDISVSDYLDFWFDNYGKMNLKYNTQLNYIQIIELHLKNRLGAYRLKSLNAATIQEYANELKVQGYSRSTMIGIITTLSGALNYAVEPLHYIAFNPCKNIKYPKYTTAKSAKLRYIITPEQFETIIDTYNADTPYYLPLMIGYYTGLRIAETFGLTWSDINLEDRTLTVNKIMVKRNFGTDVRKVIAVRGKKEVKSQWYFGTPKTESSNRTIKFGETLYQALKKMKIKQMERKMYYGEYYTEIYKKPEVDEKGDTVYRLMEIPVSVPTTLDGVNLVCRRENGALCKMDSMRVVSRTVNHRLGINYNYHSLRHTHATILVENGANIKDVQERLGHSKIETTLNTYVHNTDDMRNNTIDIFEKATKKTAN